MYVTVKGKHSNLPPRLTKMEVASPGEVVNSSDLTWKSVQISDTYDTFAIWSGKGGKGNLLMEGPLQGSVTAGDDLTIPAGQLSVTLHAGDPRGMDPGMVNAMLDKLIEDAFDPYPYVEVDWEHPDHWHRKKLRRIRVA